MDEERSAELAKVAGMYYEEQLTQEEISHRLGYSRSSISRMLSEARREGIVEIHVHYPQERSAVLEQLLAGSFYLREVRVLQSNGLVYPQVLRRLGALAAQLLEQKLQEHSILGISWGTALFEVTSALRPIHYPGVKVVQLIGSATSKDHQVDGPGLARAFAQLLEAQYFTLPAPWLVQDKGLREALMNDRRMREVLDLANQVDIALVGIGTVEPSLSSLVRAGYLSVDEVKGLQALGAVGDVCGQHFDIQGNLMDIPLAGYAIGIEVERLRSVPLVIGVAGGRTKAPSILGALRSRLVNCLVTDDIAAREVLELSGP